MKRLVALMMYAVSLGAAAQSTITYPYNPDEDGNGQIAVGDLQGILATYGNAFSPSEILVDGETLTTVLTQLQNSIDSLSSLAGGGGSVLDMPLGTVLPIATESVPEGWMLCDGREISIEDYQDLYDLIGTTFGAGDSAFWAQVFFPATTFNIPDLRGRTIIGANDMGGQESNVLLIHQGSLGQNGGTETHQLTEAEMPSHNHSIPVYEGGGGSFNFRLANMDEPNGSKQTATAGGDQPHNNMQPYMALNYMMKVQAAEDVLMQLQTTIEAQQLQIDSLIALTDVISDTLIIDVGDQYSDWYGSPVPFAAEKPFVKFVGQAPVNECYFELANPNGSVPDVIIFNASENTVRGATFTWGNYLGNNEWIHLRAVGDQWFLPWSEH